MLKTIKRKIKVFLNKLAKDNVETFGSEKLNCCDLKKYQKQL